MKRDLLTIREVAQITGYCEEHVRVLTRTGKLKSVKPNGGRFFISREDLNDFLGRKAI